MMVTRWTLQVATFGMALLLAQPSLGQRYPERPVRVVVPTTPSGSVDIMARRLSAQLSPAMGQTFLVENVPGAGNVIGTAEVARSKPDGHTLLLGATSGIVIAPAVKKRPYDGVRDFASISLLGLQEFVISAGPTLAAANFSEMIRLARAQPGKLSYGSIGVGSANHVAGELMKSASGTDIVHVPYKGAAPALADMMAGRVELTIMANSSVQALHKGGKLRALAILGESRLASLADVPTAAESGFPDMLLSSFLGLFAPAATPKSAINQLHAAVTRILTRPDFQKESDSIGLITPPLRSPEETQRYLLELSARVMPIVQRAGITEE